MYAIPILVYKVHNGAISITQWGFDNDCYIGKPCWPMGKNSCIINGDCRSLRAEFAETNIFLGFETNLDFSNQKSGCRLKDSSGAPSSNKSQEGTQIDLFRILHSL